MEIDKIVEELYVEHIESLVIEAEMAVRYEVKDKEEYYERLRTGSRALCEAIKNTLTNYGEAEYKRGYEEGIMTKPKINLD